MSPVVASPAHPPPHPPLLGPFLAGWGLWGRWVMSPALPRNGFKQDVEGYPGAAGTCQGEGGYMGDTGDKAILGGHRRSLWELLGTRGHGGDAGGTRAMLGALGHVEDTGGTEAAAGDTGGLA